MESIDGSMFSALNAPGSVEPLSAGRSSAFSMFHRVRTSSHQAIASNGRAIDREPEGLANVLTEFFRKTRFGYANRLFKAALLNAGAFAKR